MYNWRYDSEEPTIRRYASLVIFTTAAASAIILFLIFHPIIARITQESPILLTIMYGPAMAIGVLYGIKISQRVMRPSEIRSPIKRSIVKIFLFFFIIGGLFSSVNFATNGGSLMPQSTILEAGLITWVTNFVSANGGATFLIVSSITLMAAATRRIIGLDGLLNRVFTFVGTFIFFSMLALSFTQNDPTHSEVFLYTFYQAGIVGGALYEMNKLTKNLNFWEDFSNGY